MRFYRLSFQSGFLFKKGEFHQIFFNVYGDINGEVFRWSAWANTLKDYQWI